MYKKLCNNETKNYYRQILDEAITIVNSNLEQTSLSIYQNILDQLLDIKENIVVKRVILDPEEISERYSIGGIAVKNFEDDIEMQDRLMDIYSGACDYIFLNE